MKKLGPMEIWLVLSPAIIHSAVLFFDCPGVINVQHCYPLDDNMIHRYSSKILDIREMSSSSLHLVNYYSFVW